LIRHNRYLDLSDGLKFENHWLKAKHHIPRILFPVNKQMLPHLLVFIVTKRSLIFTTVPLAIATNSGSLPLTRTDSPFTNSFSSTGVPSNLG